MRYKRVLMHPSFFTVLFMENKEHHIKCIKGLPEDAKLAYIYYDNHYMLNFVIESKFFELLDDGNLIPEISPPIFEQLSCAPFKEVKYLSSFL